MDKLIGGNHKNQWESDKWHEMTFLLTSIYTKLVWEGKEERERPNEKERENRGILERQSLPLSRISGDRTVGFLRGKKQSCSPRQGLRVGTGFGEFRQTPEGTGGA